MYCDKYHYNDDHIKKINVLNRLYTLNLHNDICQIYSFKKVLLKVQSASFIRFVWFALYKCRFLDPNPVLLNQTLCSRGQGICTFNKRSRWALCRLLVSMLTCWAGQYGKAWKEDPWPNRGGSADPESVVHQRVWEQNRLTAFGLRSKLNGKWMLLF